MKYRSTGGDTAGRTFEEIVLEGAAPDGGLYLPESLPELSGPGPAGSHHDHVVAALEAFGATEVDDLVAEALSRFHHPDIAPISQVGPYLVLELFWGPTLSFKDHALQILGRLVDRYLEARDETRTVLVATSGDTGSAAIEGFRGRDAIDIGVLFPDGMVSEFQRRQMTTVSDSNVTVLAVQGSFDDCQRMVKEAFLSHHRLAAANSINWGRIAAQVGYHLSAAARVDGQVDVVIPTGNFGNAYSAWTARALGASIGSITVATNANKVLYDLHVGGAVSESAVTPTLAPAMDIQIPSNLERFLHNRGQQSFEEEFEAGWATDEEILATIRAVFDRHGVIIDPHTAVAWKVAESLPSDTGSQRLLVSTAHPAKFAETIENAIGIRPEVPVWGDVEEGTEESHEVIPPTLEALERYL